MAVEQPSLFEDEFVLLNDAVAALKALRPVDALALLHRYRDIYPGREDVEKKVRTAAFLQEALARWRT